MIRFPRMSRNERLALWPRVLDLMGLTWVSVCAFPTDTPSSPSIDQVEPYSSTAQVQFDEPEATGGVPILKYKAEWRAVGEEVWHFKWYDAKEGKRGTAGTPFRRMGCSVLGRHSPQALHPDSPWGWHGTPLSAAEGATGQALPAVHLPVLQPHPGPSRIRACSHLL